VPGFGIVNGTTLTGSAALRQNTATRSFIANGNVGALANYLNTNPFATGEPGGLARNAGLPENLIVTNPQFLNVEMSTNPGSSTYHSLVTQVTKRFSHGFTHQIAYTWSRSLGEFDSDGARITTDFSSFRVIDPRNRRENKNPGQSSDPRHPKQRHMAAAVRSTTKNTRQQHRNRGAPGGTLAIGGILSWSSGAPLTLLSGRSTITGGTTITPDIVGDFSKSMAES
jgi:hypothetical protein